MTLFSLICRLHVYVNMSMVQYSISKTSRKNSIKEASNNKIVLSKLWSDIFDKQYGSEYTSYL